MYSFFKTFPDADLGSGHYCYGGHAGGTALTSSKFMQAIELKFLLKLLGHDGYRAPISKLTVSEKTSTSERDRICIGLGERGIVEYSREVVRFKISSAGKALLKQDTENLPLTDQHISVLKACAAKTIAPGDIKKLSATERQSLIQELEAKGLVEIEKVKIKEVWLTERGSECLRDEYNPSGTATISLNLLKNYLNFLRKATQSTIAATKPSSVATVSSEKPTDEEILQTIQQLDRELGTDNYLPIFHLRKRLQPPLTRDELDQALYRLQRQDKLDLSSLVEAIHYTSEEIQAGIPQDAGGPLFFLVVNE